MTHHWKGIFLDCDPAAPTELSNLTDSKDLGLRLKRARSLEQVSKAAAKHDLDVVIIHEPPTTPGLELVRKIWGQDAPTLPTLLMCAAASGTWQETALDPKIELVSDTATPEEVRHRIATLLRRSVVAPQAVAVSEQDVTPATRAQVKPVKEVRNLDSGRLDAERIAQAFAMPLIDVAKAVGKPYTTVHKTPDAPALQALLYPFERIASAIVLLTGELQPSLKFWLNSPNNAFPNRLPVELIKQGQVDLLADLLEDVLLGQPG